MIRRFGGYDFNKSIEDNRFHNAQNVCADNYPAISTRVPHATIHTLTNPHGMIAHSKLAWVDGTQLFFDGIAVSGLTLSDADKTMINIGARIVIFPDKVYYNTHDGTYGSLENIVTTEGTVSAELCMFDGTSYNNPPISPAAPTDPVDGDYWIDSSSDPHVLKLFSSSADAWVTVETVYVKISCPGIGAGFSEYDGITISGMANAALNGDFLLYGAAADHIIVAAIIDQTFSQTTPATFSRTCPDMDFVTESKNRLWGCSSAKHEIYACAQGDPTNWHQFMGLSTDSYAATIGTPGDFTGAVTHRGYVTFFKEDYIHKLYGSRPANYSLEETESRGVQPGSASSIVIVNETLLYKSSDGVCALAAALPSSISDAFGNATYTDAVAGAAQGKYYISMIDASGEYRLFHYDTEHGEWYRDDDMQVRWFAEHDNELYYITADNVLHSMFGGTYKAGIPVVAETPVEWVLETGHIGMSYPDYKWCSKLLLRMELGASSSVAVAVKYNDSDVWEQSVTLSTTGMRSFQAPIMPRRCDTLKLRIMGIGHCDLYSITKTIEQGSESTVW